MELTTENKELLEKRLHELPSEVRSKLQDGSIVTLAKNIAAAHSLPPQQAAVLENELVLILLGFETIDDLSVNLEKEGNINKTTAAAVVGTIQNFGEKHHPSPEKKDEQNNKEAPDQAQSPPIETSEKKPQNAIPRYSRPLIDTPKYSDGDPYREPPE